MTKCLKLFVLMLLASLASVASGVEITAYLVGDAFVSIEGNDQFGAGLQAGKPQSWLVVSFEKSTGSAMNEFLGKKGATFLDERGGVFVADMHAMPRFVKRFVYPSLKKLPHRILLNESETALGRIPRERERVTVLRIDGAGKVASVDFIDPEKDLERLFAPKP